MSYQVISRS